MGCQILLKTFAHIFSQLKHDCIQSKYSIQSKKDTSSHIFEGLKACVFKYMVCPDGVV
jgi:hypothetical protein